MKIGILIIFLSLAFSCSKKSKENYETDGSCFILITVPGNQDKYHPPLVISAHKDIVHKKPQFNSYLVSQKDFEEIRNIVKNSGLKGDDIGSSDIPDYKTVLVQEQCNSKYYFSYLPRDKNESIKYINYLVKELKNAGINNEIIGQVSAFN